MAVAAAGLKILPHAQIFIYVLHVQTFAMVDGHYGTVVNGVFAVVNGVFFADDNYRGYASSGAVPITLLSRGTVVAITLTGKSSYFSVAIASKNALNSGVHEYNNNHHVAFHYNSLSGRVNSDWDYETKGTFARHYVYGGGPFTATLTLRGVDRSVSFSVNGVPQNGAWALPTTESFYLMLTTSCGGTIAVTDVMITMKTADLA